MDMTNPGRVKNISSENQKCLTELGLQSYSSVDLMSITSNFLESNKIGSGGYGEVYKGQFSEGFLLAVKVIKNMDVVEDTFMAEVCTMGKACHRNLIKLYGYCFEVNLKALVYEYMENGSLDKILYENNHGSIEWVKLYAIAIDIGNGLKYLHHDLEEQIIHHDIKAANVLLDKNFSAKIADFGLARTMKRDVSRVDLSRTRGTPNYNAPETWIPQSQVTFKCDVYSFGIMLFEILVKKNNGEAENWFPRLVWNQFENGNLEHYITTNCGIVEKDKENAYILCKVAFWCVQYDPNLRPSMKDVVLMLEKEKVVKDPPCPSFYFRQPSSPMVNVEESRRENIDRQRSDKMELDPTYPQNIITGPSYALVARSDNDDGATLQQLKSNKCKTPNSTKHLKNLRGLDENLDKLEEKMAQLNDLKSDVHHRVIAEETRLKVRSNHVNGWMKRVDAKKNMVEQIVLEGRQHLERRCLSGYCPKNWRSGNKLEKKVGKNLILVEQLIKCAGDFENVVQNRHRAQFQELPEKFTVGLDHLFERVVDLLGKDDVQILGLYGIGGVGKTTCLRKINNELPKRNNDFDIVIWVVISSDVNMRTVQEAIRERLGLMPWLNSVSLSSRASDLFHALKEVKYLILLDDVWIEINLESIGIPIPTVQNKSKIVLTTRSLDVCGHMKAHNIEVKSLNKDNSWNLFKERVGLDTLNADPQIPKLAEEVAKKCHGLPIVLITVGRSMASKTNPREWKSAILDLNKCARKFPGMELVFHLLKFSYDKLPSHTHQVCFLFCALFPEDYSIKIVNLIRYWIGAGYISNFDDYEEALNEGFNIIGILKRACLLENWVDVVKMHDVIREFALWIAHKCGKEEGTVFVKSVQALTEIPMNVFRPTVVLKICLIYTNISHLDYLPTCPNLSIFFAPQNQCLTHINDNFFLSMPALKFLNLSFTGITNVPTSICKLLELEYLNLYSTEITSLPYDMRNLTKLRNLLFGSIKQLRIIPRGMMMNFPNLEILGLQVPKSGEYDVEMHEDNDELRYLNKLKALDISISDFKDLEKFVSGPRLFNCTISLRVEWYKEITLRLNLGHFKQLRLIYIGDCSEVKELFFDCITNNDETEVWLFESLEKMLLENLPKLVISWDARNLHFAHFRELCFVSLRGCDAMVDLTWLLLIPNLQTLRVLECGSLQEILSSADNESG